MKKILVPVDYSEVSESAVNYAAPLAGEMHCELVVFHAMQVPVPPTEIPPVYFTGPELEAEQKNKLESYTDELKKKYPQTKISCELRYDFVKDGISGLTNENPEYRMIVMGITPAGTMMQAFPGGTAVNVINDISIPVLIVPQQTVFRKIRKILTGIVPGKSEETADLKELREIALLNKSSVDFIHVRVTGEDVNETWKIRTEDEITNAFRGITINFRYPYHHDLYEGLNEEAAVSNADLLVMIHRKRNFFQSLFTKEHTRKLAYNTKVPLLVIPETSNQ